MSKIKSMSKQVILTLNYILHNDPMNYKKVPFVEIPKKGRKSKTIVLEES